MLWRVAILGVKQTERVWEPPGEMGIQPARGMGATARGLQQETFA